jgi:hypothetical protein
MERSKKANGMLKYRLFATTVDGDERSASRFGRFIPMELFEIPLGLEDPKSDTYTRNMTRPKRKAEDCPLSAAPIMY